MHPGMTIQPWEEGEPCEASTCRRGVVLEHGRGANTSIPPGLSALVVLSDSTEIKLLPEDSLSLSRELLQPGQLGKGDSSPSVLLAGFSWDHISWKLLTLIFL